ncbi:ABC transporter ATP-binding protein [Streptomyces chartreusis]
MTAPGAAGAGPALEARDFSIRLLAATPPADPAIERHRNTVLLKGELPSPSNIPTGCRFHTRCPAAMPNFVTLGPPTRPVGHGQSGTVACHLHARPSPPGNCRSLTLRPSTQGPEPPLRSGRAWWVGGAWRSPTLKRRGHCHSGAETCELQEKERRGGMRGRGRTPPRVRAAEQLHRTRHPLRGNIPAYAGSKHLELLRPLAEGDIPAGCGEQGCSAGSRSRECPGWWAGASGRWRSGTVAWVGAALSCPAPWIRWLIGVATGQRSLERIGVLVRYPSRSPVASRRTGGPGSAEVDSLVRPVMSSARTRSAVRRQDRGRPALSGCLPPGVPGEGRQPSSCPWRGQAPRPEVFPKTTPLGSRLNGGSPAARPPAWCEWPGCRGLDVL